MKKIGHFFARNLTLLAAGVAFFTILGAVKPVFFNEGSAAFKYINKQLHMEAIAEKATQDYSSHILYGDVAAPENLDSIKNSISEEEAFRRKEQYAKIDSFIAGALLLLVFLTIFIPNQLKKMQLHHLLFLAMTWMIIQAVAVSLNGGKMFADVTLPAHATRWAIFPLLWLLIKNRKTDLQNGAEISQTFFWLITLAVSLTFFTHGVEAALQNPAFHNLIYISSSYISFRPSEAFVEALLWTIGFMDMALALAILFYRKKSIYLWMAFWGLLTAFSRPFTMGLDAWPELAIRIANSGLPMILFAITAQSSNELINKEKEINNA